MSKRKVMLYARFERVWHWSQMALIFSLLVTGFDIHGLIDVMAFDLAVNLHTAAAMGLIVLWMFATFWLFTTGAWKHYLPTKNGLFKVARFYAYGIFKGEHHPYRKGYMRKHNPLQALTYAGLKLFIFPAIWISGLLYLSYGFWSHASDSDLLFLIAMVHTAAAFMIVVFVIVHVYLLTVGHSFKQHVSPMITGFDEVDLTPEEEAYLETNEPGQIR